MLARIKEILNEAPSETRNEQIFEVISTTPAISWDELINVLEALVVTIRLLGKLPGDINLLIRHILSIDLPSCSNILYELLRDIKLHHPTLWTPIEHLNRYSSGVFLRLYHTDTDHSKLRWFCDEQRLHIPMTGAYIQAGHIEEAIWCCKYCRETTWYGHRLRGPPSITDVTWHQLISIIDWPESLDHENQKQGDILYYMPWRVKKHYIPSLWPYDVFGHQGQGLKAEHLFALMVLCSGANEDRFLQPHRYRNPT
jgi:hypothetical protein